MSVEIKYELSGTGWCNCTISVGEQSASVTGSYLTDVLPQFCNAAIQVLGSTDRAEFSFEEEPGEFRWIVQSESEEVAIIKIYDLQNFGDDLSDDGVKLIFNASAEKVDFARAVHRAMSEVLKLHGEDGYLERWDLAPFPSEQFSRLAAALLAANHSLQARRP